MIIDTKEKLDEDTGGYAYNTMDSCEGCWQTWILALSIVWWVEDAWTGLDLLSVVHAWGQTWTQNGADLVLYRELDGNV